MNLKAASIWMVTALMGFELLSLKAQAASCVDTHASTSMSFPKIVKKESELINRLNEVDGATGQITRRWEGDEFYLTQDRNLRTELARMTQKQDEVLSQHRIQYYPGMKSSFYEAGRWREDLTSKLNILAGQLTTAARRDKDFDPSTVKFSQWIGKVVYGTRFVFMAEGKKISLLDEQQTSLLPTDSSVNDPRTKVSITATSYAGHITQIQAINVNGSIALKITIQNTSGTPMTIISSNMSILNELLSLKAVNPDF